MSQLLGLFCILLLPCLHNAAAFDGSDRPNTASAIVLTEIADHLLSWILDLIVQHDELFIFHA